jgi:hypothetical protein
VRKFEVGRHRPPIIDAAAGPGEASSPALFTHLPARDPRCGG